jgi:hypothetical protein
MSTNSHYGKLPVFLGDHHKLDLQEMMYYLYLPVCMDATIDQPEILIPPNIDCCRELIHVALRYYRSRLYPSYRYIYLSARKGWATPDSPLNRPGWHTDGFGTYDLNFVWWKGPGTRFAHQAFKDISEDHALSLKQFEEQVRPECIVTFLEGGFYAMNPNVVHTTPLIIKPCMRQYVKVSVSNHRYNLENNSHNYLFDYDWPMHDRDAMRNDPHRAQADHYER